VLGPVQRGEPVWLGQRKRGNSALHKSRHHAPGRITEAVDMRWSEGRVINLRRMLHGLPP
jgi:hypothetical protein